MTLSIQAQAVLFNTPINVVLKSASSLLRSAHRYGCDVTIKYGDASSAPCLSATDISTLNDLAPGAIHYNFFNENTGFGKGHNLLAQSSNSDYLLIINPDVIVNPDFFDAVLTTFKENENAGIVEARQIPLEHPKDYDRTTGETEWSSGACMTIPTELFIRLKGFDWQAFWMYCEDVDISWRVRMLGKQVIFQPHASALHPKSLNDSGGIVASETEQLYSAYTSLVLAYKWNNAHRLNSLLRKYASSHAELQKKALQMFQAAKKRGDLPKQIEKPNISRFYPDGNYAKHRF